MNPSGARYNFGGHCSAFSGLYHSTGQKEGKTPGPTLFTQLPGDTALPGIVGAAARPEVVAKTSVITGHLKVALKVADAAVSVVAGQLHLVDHAGGVEEKFCGKRVW
ncbi:hypothetical protein TYRP_020355 [Tyrophagus putrescentiae]|nr:hypothetical protein TYRP_020355 [Tyrophagus putrescentiae]